MCFGDSGGPVWIEGNGGRLNTIVGVVTESDYDTKYEYVCGHTKHFATKLNAKILKWIKRHYNPPSR